jgi:hypothetical protein
MERVHCGICLLYGGQQTEDRRGWPSVSCLFPSRAYPQPPPELLPPGPTHLKAPLFPNSITGWESSIQNMSLCDIFKIKTIAISLYPAQHWKLTVYYLNNCICYLSSFCSEVMVYFVS